MEENKTNETTVTETVENQEATTTETKVEETKPEVKLDKNQILRDMSKEYGVNLYSAEGLAEFKKFQDSKKTEQERLTEELNSYKEKETQFNTQKEAYEAQIAGLQLGIEEAKLTDALALAKLNMTEGQTIKDGLAAVKEKYPEMFSKATSTKTEVVIGTQKEEGTGEHEEMDEALARYLKKQKK